MSKLKSKRERARHELEKVETEIAELTASIERIEAGIEDRREARSATAEDDERRAELRTAIRQKLRQREQARADLDRTTPRASKLKRAVRRLTRKIRNSARPKIVKLDLSFRQMTPQGEIIGTTGHYTAGATDDDDDDALRLWGQVHAAHLAQGWSGIGYQVGFTRAGTIVLLRPFTSVGSHTLGANTGRIGCSVHGTTGDTWTQAQRRAYAWWLKNGHTGKFPASHRTPRKPRELQIRVHKDFNATSCPGGFESGYRNP